MRRKLVAVLAAVLMLLCCRPALAFHHHYSYYQPAAPVVMAPTAPAPISGVLLSQLLMTGLQVAANTAQNYIGSNNPQQPPRETVVDAAVASKLSKVDDDIKNLTAKTDSIVDMNPTLYKGLKLKSSSATDARGSTTESSQGVKGPHGQD
jgi:hypothetical protein